MRVLNKLALQNLKLNKKRTIGTIIGIILSVALICAVAGLGSSLKETLVVNAIDETGYYHLELRDINNEKLREVKNNRDVKDVIEINHIGTSKYSYLNDETSEYFDVYSMGSEEFKDLSYKLTQGRLPNNSSEIVVSSKLLANDNKNIGDVITLNVGHMELFSNEISNAKEKTYKIVGVISKKIYNDYYGITTMEKSDYKNVYISLKKPKEYKESIPHILGLENYALVEYHDLDKTKFDYNVNNELLRWETFAFSDSTVTMLYTLILIVVLVIVGTSIFCIRNSFAISSQEKRKMYGMLASIGATKRQLKQAVLKEGFIIGFLSIPIGIILGLLADFILVKVCNLILGDFLFDTGIVFKISILPIILTIIMGVITIYFSALGSAKKTSKISPIEALKSSDEIKITSKKLKTPKMISKLFNIGGVIAYKNLKRSKKKYRTTVISITVSILTFISMSSFISETSQNVGVYYQDLDYNISLNGVSDLTIDEINRLDKVSDIKNKYFVYELREPTTIDKPKYDEDYQKNSKEMYDGFNEDGYISVLALDDKTFRSYINKLGKSYDELKDKGILFDVYMNIDDGDTVKKKRIYKYNKKDKINISFDSGSASIEIGDVNLEKPYGLENTFYTDGFIVVNKDYYKIDFTLRGVCIDSANVDNTLRDIESTYDGKDLIISNMEEKVKSDKAMLMLVSIFLYGFIGVITLIGVTNIFNTITSNVDLRAKEFAMLKSIGMTKKEFRRMINLETIFYSGKSLFYGIILGILGSVVIHKAFEAKFHNSYVLPYKPIIISIVAVFIIVYIIMRYSIKRVNKQNIIETIRNDNI